MPTSLTWFGLVSQLDFHFSLTVYTDVDILCSDDADDAALADVFLCYNSPAENKADRSGPPAHRAGSACQPPDAIARRPSWPRHCGFPLTPRGNTALLLDSS
eukprot:EG_transcript_10354